MFDQRNRTKFDPRSPVQSGASPLSYLVAVLVAATMVWTAAEYLVAKVMPESSREAAKYGQIGSTEPTYAKGDLRTLFSADDYPASAAANNEQGTAQAELTVDEKGRVSRCTIIRSSGHATLDGATCDILQKRARFTPAHNAAGLPVRDTVVTPPIRWQLEG